MARRICGAALAGGFFVAASLAIFLTSMDTNISF